jgi:hypothetical protein
MWVNGPKRCIWPCQPLLLRPKRTQHDSAGVSVAVQQLCEPPRCWPCAMSVGSVIDYVCSCVCPLCSESDRVGVGSVIDYVSSCVCPLCSESDRVGGVGAHRQCHAQKQHHRGTPSRSTQWLRREPCLRASWVTSRAPASKCSQQGCEAGVSVHAGCHACQPLATGPDSRACRLQYGATKWEKKTCSGCHGLWARAGGDSKD